MLYILNFFIVKEYQKSVFRKYSSYISSYQGFKELNMRFTTRLTKSYNLPG